jgi:3'(2'), 5'-bisphosphate nucleotidase
LNQAPDRLSLAELQAMLAWLLPLTRQAGQAINAIYRQSLAHPDGRQSALVRRKADQSPLTKADLAAHEAIAAGLAQHCPEIALISEESYEPEQMAQAGARFWLVDPLDGTKEFLSGTGEFTVNIALIDHGCAVLGAVYQPSTEEMFWGGRQLGAYREHAQAGAHPIAVNPREEPPWRVLASRSHMGPYTKALIGRIGQTQLIQAGSSLKFCRIAMGLADFYPRLGLTSQWDTAAAQAVLEGAGGFVLDTQGQSLRYGHAEIINAHFLASAFPYEDVKRWWGD